MKDLTKFISDFAELNKKYPVVDKLCGGPVDFVETEEGIVVECTDSSDGYVVGFINSDDCFQIAHYFALLGNLLFVINKEGINGKKETK